MIEKENFECFTPARLRRNPEKKIIFENNSLNEPRTIFIKNKDTQQKENFECFTPARLRRNPEKKIIFENNSLNEPRTIFIKKEGVHEEDKYIL